MQHSAWHALIKEQLPEGYFAKINHFLDEVYASGTIYPPREKVFNAIQTTDLADVKVVILGQDPYHGPRQAWAQQGVLLLNAGLTVPAGQANAHAGLIWEPFTDAIIKVVNAKTDPVVFILWGSYARKKKALISNSQHLIIESAHPSPLSAYRGFFGSKPFSRTNDFLVAKGLEPIDWLA